MKRREITITPYGGLANRMRALNAVIEFARPYAIPVKSVWFSNFELNAPFSELFETPSHSETDNIRIGFGIINQDRTIDAF